MLSLGAELDKKTTAQLAVLTINTLDGEPIEDYALEVLRQWGIGSKEQNNGALIVVAVKDRRSRIEVGYGLEGSLPDGLTGRIQDQYMIPYFKDGNYSKGILQGYKAAAAKIAQGYNTELSGVKYQAPAPQPQKNTSYSLDDLLFALGVIGFLIVDNLLLGGFFTRILLLQNSLAVITVLEAAAGAEASAAAAAVAAVRLAVGKYSKNLTLNCIPFW